VPLDVALVRFHGEDTAVLRYADAKDRSASDAHWAQEVGFVERHHSGRLLLRGTFAGHYIEVDEGDHVSQKGADVDDMLAALGENAQDVVRRTLAADEEAALQASISALPPAAP
jgi:hypothetical protein